MNLSGPLETDEKTTIFTRNPPTSLPNPLLTANTGKRSVPLPLQVTNVGSSSVPVSSTSNMSNLVKKRKTDIGNGMASNLFLQNAVQQNLMPGQNVQNVNVPVPVPTSLATGQLNLSKNLSVPIPVPSSAAINTTLANLTSLGNLNANNLNANVNPVTTMPGSNWPSLRLPKDPLPKSQRGLNGKAAINPLNPIPSITQNSVNNVLTHPDVAEFLRNNTKTSVSADTIRSQINQAVMNANYKPSVQVIPGQVEPNAIMKNLVNNHIPKQVPKGPLQGQGQGQGQIQVGNGLTNSSSGQGQVIHGHVNQINGLMPKQVGQVNQIQQSPQPLPVPAQNSAQVQNVVQNQPKKQVLLPMTNGFTLPQNPVTTKASQHFSLGKKVTSTSMANLNQISTTLDQGLSQKLKNQLNQLSQSTKQTRTIVHKAPGQGAQTTHKQQPISRPNLDHQNVLTNNTNTKNTKTTSPVLEKTALPPSYVSRLPQAYENEPLGKPIKYVIDPDDPNSGVPLNIGEKRVFRPIARKVVVEGRPDGLNPQKSKSSNLHKKPTLPKNQPHQPTSSKFASKSKESSHVVSNLDQSSNNFSKSHFKTINEKNQNFKTINVKSKGQNVTQKNLTLPCDKADRETQQILANANLIENKVTSTSSSSTTATTAATSTKNTKQPPPTSSSSTNRTCQKKRLHPVWTGIGKLTRINLRKNINKNFEFQPKAQKDYSRFVYTDYNKSETGQKLQALVKKFRQKEKYLKSITSSRKAAIAANNANSSAGGSGSSSRKSSGGKGRS